MSDTTLCVLAGGQSKRFGSPKTNVTLDGTPICAWLVEQFRTIATRAVLSVANGLSTVAGVEAFDQIITDQHADAGPLAGMHSVVDALLRDGSAGSSQTVNAREDVNIVFITADMPLVSIARISRLIARLEQDEQLIGVMNHWASETNLTSPDTRRGAGVEPFPSAWRMGRARVLFGDTLARGIRGPHRLARCEAIACLPIAEAERKEFSNINTRDDFAVLARDETGVHLSIRAPGTLPSP